MSIRIMTRAWDAPVSGHAEKLVLLKLADNANDEGHAWPSQATIASQCALSERTVRDCLTRLEMSGHIEKEKRDGAGNRLGYIVHPLADIPANAAGILAEGNRQTPPVKPANAAGCNRQTPPVTMPPHYVEPSSEPSGSLTAPSAAEEHKPEKPEKAKGTHAMFTELWVAAFAASFGERYIFSGGKDGAAVRRLLRETERDPQWLVELAGTAWSAHAATPRRFFHCGRAGTIAGFAAAYNDIVKELKGAQRLPGNSAAGKADEQSTSGF